MAISRDDVHLCISKSMQFLTNSAWNFAKTHPFLSLTLFFFSFLYVCFPWFFWALVHFLAFLILVGSITRIYYCPSTKKSSVNDKNSNADSLKSVNISKNDSIKDRNGRPFVRAKSVRQRRSRETSRTSSVQGSEDEKNMVILSSTFNNDMVDKNPLLEENLKEIREVKIDKFFSKAECPSSIDPESLKPDSVGKSHQEPQKSVGGGGDIESESSEEDEQEREENIKAVQWTEDDEKNLMDLGISEIERNKRLESLIARRRARKLLSLQIKKTLNKDISLIPHIAIPKNKPFFELISGQLSPTPGSAPPVLLPVHDPFDLPYDPHEEKPDLTGGSFHQEFIPPEPQDHVYCRHASFSLGNRHPGDFKQDLQETWTHDLTNKHMASEGLQNSNFENQIEEKDTDKIIEVESCHSPGFTLNNIKADQCNTEEIQSSEKGTVLVDITEENKNTEVETKAVVVDNPSYRTSSNSSEEDAPFMRVDKEAILKSLTTPHPRSMSLNRDTSNQMRYMLNNYCSPMMNNGTRHKPTHSIASDMQVEVSEVSSPPQTIDGSVSSFDIGSPIEEEDITSDITYRNESQWDLSSQPSINDEDKSALKEIYKLHDENTIKLGSSRSLESNGSVSLHELAKSMEEQDVTDSFSMTASKDELLTGNQNHIADIHMEVKDKFETSTPESSQPLTSGTTAFPDAENVKKLTEKQMVQHCQSDGAEILEESTYASASPMEAHSSPSSTESNAGHERRQKETMEVPEITSTKISLPDTITALQNPEVESNPSFSDEIKNKSEDPQEHADLPDLANLSEQVNQSKRLLANTEESYIPSTSSTEANSIPSRIEFEVTKHEGQQDENMELPESTSTKIREPDTMAAQQRPMEGTNPSTLVKINDESDETHEQEPSHPSTSSTEASSFPTWTDTKIAEHERRQNEPMEVTQSTSTRITSPDKITSSQKPFEEFNSSFLDTNNNLEDSHAHEAPPALANPNEQVNELTRLPIDTNESARPSTSGMTTISPLLTESSVAEDERQNETIEVRENASSRSTLPITKETLQESIAESSPLIFYDEDDKTEGPHNHGAQSAFINPDKQVDQEHAPLIETEVSQLEADASATSSHEKETSGLVEGQTHTSDNGKLPRNSDSEDTADETEKSDAQLDRSELSVLV